MRVSYNYIAHFMILDLSKLVLLNHLIVLVTYIDTYTYNHTHSQALITAHGVVLIILLKISPHMSIIGPRCIIEAQPCVTWNLSEQGNDPCSTIHGKPNHGSASVIVQLQSLTLQ